VFKPEAAADSSRFTERSMTDHLSLLAQTAAADTDLKIWFYVGFIAMVAVFLALDLGVFNRKAHEISMKEALRWTGVWITTALLFSVAIYFIYQNNWLGIGIDVPQGAGKPPRNVGGTEATGLFLTGWMLEYALSMDNIFVIAMVFKYFAVPRIHQHRVLFWGIMGALVLRGVMIWLGAELIHKFHWIEYVFGAFLIYTGIKMLSAGDAHVEPDKNPVVRLARKLVTVSPHFEGENFFTRVNGVRAVTPMFLVLLVVESTDVVFAVDSIPAVFGVTRDPFIIFTSNIFAILGLRSLYFALASLMGKFEHLKYALSFILVFIGGKMLAMFFGFTLSPMASLAIIAGSLATGVVSSLVFGKSDEPAASETPDNH
jgi:tellurite resistance protein TerC